jgi:hypothetical protein
MLPIARSAFVNLGNEPYFRNLVLEKSVPGSLNHPAKEDILYATLAAQPLATAPDGPSLWFLGLSHERGIAQAMAGTAQRETPAISSTNLIEPLVGSARFAGPSGSQVVQP